MSSKGPILNTRHNSDEKKAEITIHPTGNHDESTEINVIINMIQDGKILNAFDMSRILRPL